MRAFILISFFLYAYNAGAVEILSSIPINQPLVSTSNINLSALVNTSALSSIPSVTVVNSSSLNSLNLATLLNVDIIRQVFPFINLTAANPLDLAALGIPFFPGICQSPSEVTGVGINTVSCDYDCAEQHGALYGACNKNTVCACTYPGEDQPCFNDTKADFFGIGQNYVDQSVDVRTQNQFVVQQCYSGKYGVKDIYESGCYGDCVCNHGTTSGFCDFEKKICNCTVSKGYNASTATTSECTSATKSFKKSLEDAIVTFSKNETFKAMLCDTKDSGIYPLAKFNQLNNLIYVNDSPMLNYTVNSTTVAIDCKSNTLGGGKFPTYSLVITTTSANKSSRVPCK